MDRNRFKNTRSNRDGLALPSRSAILASVQESVSSDCRVILITGEAGVGKTWLLNTATRSMDLERSWLWVDTGPTTTPVELMADLAHQVGLECRSSDTVSYLMRSIRDRLEETSLDGHSWSLVVDEAHLASSDVLEQIRLITNESNLGQWLRPTIISGQTSLLKRIRGSRLTSFDSRVDLSVHLKPFDADEAQTWLSMVSGNLDRDQVEAWHRDSLGNPARLLRCSRQISKDHSSIIPAHNVDTVGATVPFGSIEPPDLEALIDPIPASLVPSVPPLQIEEGVIEVGWVGSDSLTGENSLGDESDSPSAFESPMVSTYTPQGSRLPGTVELIHDRYAALQAWEEWSSAQVDDLESALDESDELTLGELADDSSLLYTEEDLPESPLGTDVWTDPADRFAPFGNLFGPRTSVPQEEASHVLDSET